MIIDFGNRGNGGGSTGGGIGEAPKDGKLYGRQDGTWSEVPEGAIGIWLPDYWFKKNPDTGSLEMEIKTPLTEEQKQENIKNLPILLKDENAVGYFKRIQTKIGPEGSPFTRVFNYAITYKYFMEDPSAGFSINQIRYTYAGSEDNLRYDLNTGDLQFVNRSTSQIRLVSGKNIKTINGQDILGAGNLEFAGGGGMVEKSFTLYSPSIEKDPTQPNQFRVREGSVLTPEQKQNNMDALKEIKTLCKEQTYQPDISIYLGGKYYKVILSGEWSQFNILYENYKLGYEFNDATGDVRYIGINLDIPTKEDLNGEEYRLFVPSFAVENGQLVINSNHPLTQEQIDSNIVVLQKINDDGANLTKDEQALLMEKVVLIQRISDLNSIMLTPTFRRYPKYFEAIFNSWKINLNFQPDGNILLNKYNSTKLSNDVNEAPKDGKLYGRKDGTWSEVTGGGSVAEAPIEVVVPGFDFQANPITIKYDITPEDKTANIAASAKITEKINAGETPNVIIRDNRKYGYFTPWKINVLRGKVGFVAMQEVYSGRNEIVGYNVEADGSVTAFASWKGADVRNLRTINGESIVGSGDIVISGGGIADAPVDGKQYARQDGNWVETVSKTYVDEIVGTANNRLNLI